MHNLNYNSPKISPDHQHTITNGDTYQTVDDVPTSGKGPVDMTAPRSHCKPQRYCYKLWEEDETKLRTDPTQARGARSINKVPSREFDPHNNKIMLQQSIELNRT